MKTVKAQQLVDAYNDLNPGEHKHPDNHEDSASARTDVEHIFNSNPMEGWAKME